MVVPPLPFTLLQKKVKDLLPDFSSEMTEREKHCIINPFVNRKRAETHARGYITKLSASKVNFFTGLENKVSREKLAGDHSFSFN